MKRLLVMLIILFSLYLGIEFGFKFFGKGHTLNYEIKMDEKVFNVEEIYTLNHKNEINNYYFNIEIDDTVFSFQTYENFNRSDMIIKKIRHFKNQQYECILPIFRGEKVLLDIMCINNNVITYYHNLKGQNEELDNFVTTIEDKNYSVSKWTDDRSDKIDESPITVYPNNILDNHYVGINNYKGIYTINNINLKKIVDVNIFINDIYERKLSAMVGKFYVTANYEENYEFSKFFIVDLTSNKVEAAVSNRKISFDSYVQGSVGNSLYLFDRNSKRQYEVDTKSRKIIEVGNVETGVRYYNKGEWERIDANEAVKKDILFKDITDSSSNSDYVRIDRVGNELSGHYYFYKKVGSVYDIYRANIRNEEIITYLFSTNKIDNINYVRDYVYFSENNEVKYYNDKSGVRTLFKNDEFEFNKSLFYNIYLKK
jgi:hypothetical protein